MDKLTLIKALLSENETLANWLIIKLGLLGLGLGLGLGIGLCLGLFN